ncbi:MAG: S-layer homology domain-containing protein, partial [Bacteroidales bacterium]
GTAMMPGIVPPLTNQDLSQVFADISEAEWASEAINSLYDKGIVAGTDKNHFSPNDNITREAYVKIIVGAFGLTSDDAKAKFIDVSNSHWAYKEINIANALGVVEGISETEFGIGRAITREDMMVIASRAIDKTDIRLKAIKEAEEFTDAAAISDYAKTAVKRLVEAGYVSGFEDGSVQPKGNTTRAQAAYVIYKLMGGK